MNQTKSIEAKAAILRLMVAAGWPQKIGLNDKQHCAHNRLSLDTLTVHTFWTKGHDPFIYDPALHVVTRGKTRDAALIAMVHQRQDLARRDSGRAGTVPAENPEV